MDSLCEAVYKLSGCKSVTEFILSPVFCRSVKRAYLADDVSWGTSIPAAGEPPALGNLQFSLTNLRAREEAGSLTCFLHALPISIPSCKHLELLGIAICSLDELTALCCGIASPLCSLQSLVLNIRVAFADHAPAETKRLIGEALSRNGSIQSLTIISELCPQEHWIPCYVYDLHVKLVGNDTLDVFHSVFLGLADNTLALSTISITGPDDMSKASDSSGFMQPTMLEAEKLLGCLLETNTTLTGVHLYNLVIPAEAFQMLFTSLSRNPNLTCFSLIAYPCLPGEVVRMLFAALERNPYLASLDLSYNCGEDWPRASSVLDSLRRNGVLTDFTCYESPIDEELGEEENVDGVTWEVLVSQLESNRCNVEQRKAMESLKL